MPQLLAEPTEAQIRDVIAPLQGLEGPLLPMLHALQEHWGYVPQAAAPVICAALNISRAEFHGVVSFYHDFREAPAGRHVLKICRAEACQAMGGTELAGVALDRLGVDWHGTTANGAVTVEPVYCLGLCACAPAAMIDGRVVGRLDAEGMTKLCAEAGA
ncbi:formate dehydrogenase subunit gamma [Szabonella alba]|uniref:Formate dehydrogenase subunit gamma n=1 Tax=Szabonella alba TaxID=2804194 RepID=A0A8K0V9R7_9RHOB|nr:formate dehydrogenase subunit gamma [Szabonella alba]MBL4917948.1 formate dehydrogenase subunit gamma [Szabonella alba]